MELHDPPKHDCVICSLIVLRALTHRLAARLLGVDIRVFVVDREDERFNAWYGEREFTYNVACLGLAFFDGWQDPEGREKVLGLIIHELGHEYESSHLDANYHRATTRLGARLAIVALSDPELFQPAAHRGVAGGEDLAAAGDDDDLVAAIASLDTNTLPRADGGGWPASARGGRLAAAIRTLAMRLVPRAFDRS